MFRKLCLGIYLTDFPNYRLPNGLDDSREKPDDH